MEIPQEGRYTCKLNSQMIVYEASTGSLCAAVPCVMTDTGFTFKHTLVLVKSDGTINTRTIDTLKEVFGWDGVDPFWIMDQSEDNGSMRLVEFEITGGPETGDKGGVYFKSQWLNPAGGGMKTPAAADRRSVLSKYGGKFAALSGATAAPTSPPTPVPPKTPAAPRKTAPTPPPGAPVATMEEAWEALNQRMAGKESKEVEKAWFAAIAKLFPNKSNTDLKPHEWGKLKAEFEDELPM